MSIRSRLARLEEVGPPQDDKNWIPWDYVAMGCPVPPYREDEYLPDEYLERCRRRWEECLDEGERLHQEYLEQWYGPRIRQEMERLGLEYRGVAGIEDVIEETIRLTGLPTPREG